MTSGHPASIAESLRFLIGFPSEPLLFCLDRRSGVSQDLMADFASTLSPEERQRHSAYRLTGDRDRFLLGRGLLRHLLAHVLNTPASSVPVEVGFNGKPYCPGGPQFNISHSGALILLALHPNRPVGVDVEKQRADLDWEPIARRLFSSQQVEALLEQPQAEQRAAFLQAWCQLEAELKAGGWGLAAAPPPGLCQLTRHWRLHLPEGYVGAVAMLPAPAPP
ncbi:4'-phosphopantetheinyl transferase superfamily protein [Cyanobium sp. ATX 6A2]|uniref:4'-phosphopantetheinyl transferase family protein n=1 Tax=Cyanobium sp. ATX 6A2 TaxID=2823700 RepID=UPI0020CC3C25|nr:4'-phosphopantetheinyl transferase superfamily protein [Cyanobium sp. ATX 6A2]